jgi:hypothetical protein
MGADDLSSFCSFLTISDVVFSMGDWKLVVLMTQSHAQVMPPRNCIAKVASLRFYPHHNEIIGVGFVNDGV